MQEVLEGGDPSKRAQSTYQVQLRDPATLITDISGNACPPSHPGRASLRPSGSTEQKKCHLFLAVGTQQMSSRQDDGLLVSTQQLHA